MKLGYTSVRPKLESFSVAWYSITSSDIGNLRRIQQQMRLFFHHRFLSHLDHSYGNVWNYLKFYVLTAGTLYLDVLFFKNISRGWKYRPTVLEIVGLRVPNRNF